MSQLEFVYRNGRGDIKTHKLAQGWKEAGKYLSGHSEEDGAWRTFLIFRVVEYLAGSAELLKNSHQAPPEKLVKESRSEILFTGFLAADRSRLEEFAEASGMKVVKTVTAKLLYLCAGANAGPKKVEAARERGLYILSEADLQKLIETGELPDAESDSLLQ